MILQITVSCLHMSCFDLCSLGFDKPIYFTNIGLPVVSCDQWTWSCYFWCVEAHDPICKVQVSAGTCSLLPLPLTALEVFSPICLLSFPLFGNIHGLGKPTFIENVLVWSYGAIVAFLVLVMVLHVGHLLSVLTAMSHFVAGCVLWCYLPTDMYRCPIYQRC